MSNGNNFISNARLALAEIREKNASELKRRYQEVYGKIPELMSLDRQIQGSMVDFLKLCSTPDTSEKDFKSESLKIQSENLALQEKRRELLRRSGYPENYTDEIYDCAKCKDTGFIAHERCDCLNRLINIEITKGLSTLLTDENESFENFNLNYYDNVPDSSGVSPREMMEMVYDTCLNYAENFGKDSPNLLFRGGTGLGKTFLSAAIARKLFSNGFSVTYDTVFGMISQFEKSKFSKDQGERDEAAAKVSHYLSSDLMILDDLGTEMQTSFSKSALYVLINSRLINKLPTIISTNLTLDEIEELYTPQIYSRIQGEYLLLPFFGRDIRRIKKEL